MLNLAGERAPHESVEDATSQVKIKEAFATPDNLQNCLGFLRSYAADRKARASCAVVPAQQIAYPQVRPDFVLAVVLASWQAWHRACWTFQASSFCISAGRRCCRLVHKPCGSICAFQMSSKGTQNTRGVCGFPSLL